jgi:hypothetical protein
MGNGNLLFESVFNRTFSSEGTEDYLTEITKEHPYFSTAQFFLLLCKDNKSNTYEEQVAKTSVLFNNPHWLQFQLQENRLEYGETANGMITDNYKSEFPLSHASASAQTIEAKEIPAATETTGKVYTQSEEMIEVNDSLETTENVMASQQRETTPALIAETDALPPTDEPVFLHPGKLVQEPIQENTEQAFTPENIILNKKNRVDEIIEENESTPIFTEPVILSSSLNEKEIDTGFIDTPILEVPEDKDEIVDAAANSAHFINEGTPLVNEPETEDGMVTEKEIEPLHFKLNIDTSGTTEDSIVFEPLHTTDYFASLGIKLSTEILPTDKLGKQLKSFTEWLKTMKKIHNNQLPILSGQSDLSIQKLAEKSNKEDGVETEAMADVLLQQGKVDKAIELYKKLSLLNPSKRAYFAAKIDQLKEH